MEGQHVMLVSLSKDFPYSGSCNNFCSQKCSHTCHEIRFSLLLLPCQVLVFAFGTRPHVFQAFPCHLCMAFWSWHYFHSKFDTNILYLALLIQEVRTLGHKMSKTGDALY